MDLTKLLERLKERGISVAEERKLPDGTVIYLLRATLPPFPFGHQEVWYSLVIEPNQITVEREEIDALLRHLWHGAMDIFDSDLPSKKRPERG